MTRWAAPLALTRGMLVGLCLCWLSYTSSEGAERSPSQDQTQTQDAVEAVRLAAEKLGMRAPSSTSGSCMSVARASRKTMARRCGGTVPGLPLSKGMLGRSRTSGSCMTSTKASPRITRRRCGGTASPPTRGSQSKRGVLKAPNGAPVRIPIQWRGPGGSPLSKSPRITRRRCGGMGFAYATDHGIPQDYSEAVHWFRLAAEQGFARTQYNLGVMYAEGRGVPRDYVAAYMWFDLAATQSSGDERDISVTARDALAAGMTPEQIAEAQRLVREWKPTVEP